MRLSRLETRPLILDGAVGSFIEQQGVSMDNYLWSSFANLKSPETVIKVHKSYIDSGCDIITTNTFRTNPIAVKYSNHSISIKDFVSDSVNLAKKASENTDLIIFGCNAPAEDCYQVSRNINRFELEDNHKFHIDYLFTSGVDYILNETLSHWDEIEIIGKFCYQNNIPFVVSLFYDDNLNILSGEPVNEVIDFVKIFNPQAISLNCIRPQRMKLFYEKYGLDKIDGFYLNCGNDDYTAKNIKCVVSPEQYLESIKKYFTDKMIFIGGCCGTNPSHIKCLKDFLSE